MQENNKTRAIAVFAHNEAHNVIECLESVRDNIREGDECVVLNNGSTDITSKLVAEFARHNDFCKLVDIAVGDKSNAWNVFVHEVRIDACIFCFLDGDCKILPGSLDALQKCMANNPTANAAAAIPADGIGESNRAALLAEGGLAGNLYALSQSFVERIRKTSTNLPFGLIGDDSLVGALAYWDLNPQNSWVKARIAVCKEAKFSYEPLSILSFYDIKLYYKRKVRYSLRRLQNALLRKPIKQNGLTGIPPHIDDLYLSYASEVRLAWRGVHTWFDWLAIRAIKGRIKNAMQANYESTPDDGSNRSHGFAISLPHKGSTYKRRLPHKADIR